MTFETFTKPSENSENSVDFDALNKYIVETCELEEQEVITGIISGIISLGTQQPKDGEYLYDPSKEEPEEVQIEKNPSITFETREKFFQDGKILNDVRVKVVPKKPQQLIAMTVDFPDILLNKGKFFSDDGGEDLPLRMLIGGEFWDSEMIVAKPMSLQVRKSDKTNNQWTIPFQSTLYKMAVGAKIVKQGEPFLPENVGELLGKALQFKVQIKLNSKGYLTEKCAYAAGLGRGQTEPEIDESLLHLIQFTKENDEKAVKNLRKSIINSIKRGEQYEGSILQKQIEDIRGNSNDSESENNNKKVEDKKPKNEKVSSKEDDDLLDDFFDDDIDL